MKSMTTSGEIPASNLTYPSPEIFIPVSRRVFTVVVSIKDLAIFINNT